MQPHFIFDFKVLFSNFIEKVLMICIYMLCYCSPAKENTVQCMELWKEALVMMVMNGSVQVSKEVVSN